MNLYHPSLQGTFIAHHLFDIVHYWLVNIEFGLGLAIFCFLGSLGKIFLTAIKENNFQSHPQKGFLICRIIFHHLI
jgi:hypothetical protein